MPFDPLDPRCGCVTWHTGLNFDDCNATVRKYNASRCAARRRTWEPFLNPEFALPPSILHRSLLGLGAPYTLRVLPAVCCDGEAARCRLAPGDGARREATRACNDALADPLPDGVRKVASLWDAELRCENRWTVPRGYYTQFRQMAIAFQMLAAHERLRGACFRWVMRLRTDVAWRAPLDAAFLSLNTTAAALRRQRPTYYLARSWDRLALMPRAVAPVYFSVHRSYNDSPFSAPRAACARRTRGASSATSRSTSAATASSARRTTTCSASAPRQRGSGSSTPPGGGPCAPAIRTASSCARVRRTRCCSSSSSAM